MIRYTLIAALVLVNALSIYGQSQNEKGYFMYEPEQFSPPTQALVATFEGQPAEPFMANDIVGTEQTLSQYKDSKLVLWFWDTESPLALSQLDDLNKLHALAGTSVVSFARKPSAALRRFAADQEVNFPVIGNADIFGQMAYGADLGYPRFFLIDEYGIIKIVLPSEAFAGEAEIFPILRGILDGF
jgi:peroxiredoxin